jgi:hypothetical protein
MNAFVCAVYPPSEVDTSVLMAVIPVSTSLANDVIALRDGFRQVQRGGQRLWAVVTLDETPYWFDVEPACLKHLGLVTEDGEYTFQELPQLVHLPDGWEDCINENELSRVEPTRMCVSGMDVLWETTETRTGVNVETADIRILDLLAEAAKIKEV